VRLLCDGPTQHDLHATLLHLRRLDHESLNFAHSNHLVALVEPGQGKVIEKMLGEKRTEKAGKQCLAALPAARQILLAIGANIRSVHRLLQRPAGALVA
jgi:hypothetical protein